MRRWRRPIPWAGSAACPQWDAHPPSPLPFRESGSLQKPWHCLNITEFHKWKCWWNSGTGTRAPPCSAESVLFRSKINPLPSGPNPSVFGPLLSLPRSRFSGPSRRRAHRKTPQALGESPGMVSRAGAVRCIGIFNPALLRLQFVEEGLRASGPLLESYVNIGLKNVQNARLLR